jgi:DNA-binding response OmpR family regulator
LDLTPKEFEVLEMLLRNVGLVLTRERVMDSVWGGNWFGSSKTLDMHISSLRRKLALEGETESPIATVRGVGFRFDG